MCGIAGIIAPSGKNITTDALKLLADTLVHRGPDGSGYWVNEQHNLGLAHRRLAIIDTTEAASQPMHYLHYTIILNGEIYNYRELKNELQQKGYRFRTASDTEVIPAAFDCWGTDALQRMDGMFAFALYDAKAETLYLVRDRFGEKPLYYHASIKERGRFDSFWFASEMKALWAAGVQRNVNGTMLLHYLGLGYVNNPIKKTQTFFNDILSLPPGHLIQITPAAGKFQMMRWYQPVFENMTETEVIKNIELFTDLFAKSIQRRLRSDVPVGTSLSGGIDSSAVAAVMKQYSDDSSAWRNIAFTASFPGFEKDETAFSSAVARHLHLNVEYITPQADDLVSEWNQWMYHQEEPVQSSSVFTQYKVYERAKQAGITVLLDGQGADETIGGYTRYLPWHLHTIMRQKGIVSALKEKKSLQQNGFHFDWNIRHYAAALFPEKTALLLQDRAFKQVKNTPHIRTDFLTQYQNRDMLLKPVVHQLEDMLYHTTFSHGLEELLRYADRNSMAHGREVRLPFLNHELVAFLFSIPASVKIREGYTKWVLRKSAEEILPNLIVWRKGKTGYEPPQQSWLSQPLMQAMIREAQKELVEARVLNEDVLRTPLLSSAAHDAINFEWRCLNAAYVLKQRL